MFNLTSGSVSLAFSSIIPGNHLAKDGSGNPYTFKTKGGNLLIFFSRSGYITDASGNNKVIGAKLRFSTDVVSQAATTDIFATNHGVRTAFVPVTVFHPSIPVPAGAPDGTREVTLTIEPSTPDTTINNNDHFCVTILEFQ